MLDFYDESNKNVVFIKILFYMCLFIPNSIYYISLNLNLVNIIYTLFLISNNLFPIIYSVMKLYNVNFFEIFYIKLNKENIQKCIYEIYLILSICIYLYETASKDAVPNFLLAKNQVKYRKFKIIGILILISYNLLIDYFTNYEDVRKDLIIEINIKRNIRYFINLIKKLFCIYYLNKSATSTLP